jgi:hypothetical protein
LSLTNIASIAATIGAAVTVASFIIQLNVASRKSNPNIVGDGVAGGDERSQPPSAGVLKNREIGLGILKKAVLSLSLGAIAGLGLYVLISANSHANGTVSASTRPVAHASSSPLSTHTPAPTSPIKFQTPKAGTPVGREISVTLIGTQPTGSHLWIFVYSSGDYYVQGAPTPYPSDTWFLSGITLGGDASTDVNAPYTIYAVMADSRANATIEKVLNAGGTGESRIPGGAGAREVAQVTVIRTS